MTDLHRSDVQEQAHAPAIGYYWVESIPLPFYGIRKQCECGRKFWKEENYRKHWRSENVMALLKAWASQSTSIVIPTSTHEA